MRRSHRLFAAAFAGALLIASAPPLRSAGRVHRAGLSRDLEQFLTARPAKRARVIVSGDPAALEALARRHGARMVRALEHGGVLEANGVQLQSLTEDPAIDHLSGDALVRSDMKVTNRSTAADQARAGSSGLLGLLGSYPAINGQGVTIAVVDSGIADHPALSNKIIASVDFVTGANGRAADAYGHGTHVAGIIAGLSSAAVRVTSLFDGGIAPGARLINLRALGPDGSGLTSDVIAAIDWAIANRGAYKIRVLNLSLGHPVLEPCATDPLCQAVGRASAAGIVVVASAGNAGKADDGSPILGGISSPGNSPFAITVGAINTWGTVDRSDDTVATYSSRGPSRYDLGVKPDLVAPGNKVISLEAAGSLLARNYPTLHIAGSGPNSYIRLSGTSMAAAVVSGVAALILQANPTMGPERVKLALQTSATFMLDGGLMATGAGSLNAVGARRIANQGLVDPLSLLTVVGVSTNSGGVSFWDAGTLSDRLYRGVGIRLIDALLAPLVWLSPSLLHWGDLNLLGLGNPIASVAANHVIWGDVSTWSDSNHVIWGDNLTNPEGQHVIWGDNSSSDSEHVIWGDSFAESGEPR